VSAHLLSGKRRKGEHLSMTAPRGAYSPLPPSEKTPHFLWKEKEKKGRKGNEADPSIRCRTRGRRCLPLRAAMKDNLLTPGEGGRRRGRNSLGSL